MASNTGVKAYNAGQPTRPISDMKSHEVVGLVDDWFERVVKNRVHVERDALLNIAFLLDNQYVDISRTGNSVKLIQKPSKNRVRTVEQIIEPAVRSEMARLLRTRPQGTVIPQGEDPEDYEAAQAADDVHHYIYSSREVESYLEQAVLWIIAGGTAVLGAGYDPQRIDENDNQGDYVFRSLSVFEFGVPSIRRTRLNDQRYVMVTKAYELEEIEERWGVRVEPDRSEKFGTLDDRLNSILSTSSSTGVRGNEPRGTSAGQQDIPMAIVKETWVKPGILAPQGAVIITANQTILDIKPWPKWCKNKYPFHKLEYTQVPGSFWSKPMINPLIPLQRRHNRAASVVVEQMNTLAQTRLSAPRGTQVRGLMGGKAVLFETPLGATQQVGNIQAPPIGDLPFRELENTRIAVRDISHQHEVTKGTTPPNVRSGTAINALKELDDAASTIPVRSIERAIQGLGRNIIAIAQEHWDEDRLIYVLGTDGDVERHSFVSGNDLGGQFIVQAGSAWPYSRAEREQSIYKALEYQIISPEEAGKYLEFGSTRNIMRGRSLDERHARRENQKFTAMSAVNPQTGQPDPQMLMAQFQQLLPADWHNHMVHLQEHNKVRKSPSYERWESWKRQLFESHITGHMAAVMSQMEQASGVGGAPTPEEQMRQQELAIQEAQAQAQAQQSQETQ